LNVNGPIHAVFFPQLIEAITVCYSSIAAFKDVCDAHNIIMVRRYKDRHLLDLFNQVEKLDIEINAYARPLKDAEEKNLKHKKQMRDRYKLEYQERLEWYFSKTVMPQREMIFYEAQYLARAQFKIVGVNINSPGSIKFSGIYSALDVIRSYINDRFEREKQRRYKMEIEEGILREELNGLRLKNIEAGVKILKQAKVPDHEIHALLRDTVITPLSTLDRFQNSRLITDSSLTGKCDNDESKSTP